MRTVHATSFTSGMFGSGSQFPRTHLSGNPVHREGSPVILYLWKPLPKIVEGEDARRSFLPR